MFGNKFQWSYFTVTKGGIEGLAGPANAVPLQKLCAMPDHFLIEATPTKLKVATCACLKQHSVSHCTIDLILFMAMNIGKAEQGSTKTV